MRRFLYSIADLLFPPHCHGCGEPIGDSLGDFCRVCQDDLKAGPIDYCFQCGSSRVEGDQNEEGCRECHDRRLPWEQVIRHGIYQGGLRNIILRMKRRGEESLANALGREWGRQWGQWSRFAPESFTKAHFFPIPRHWLKTFWMGHNPATGIARGLAGVLGGILNENTLIRVRPTRKQADLPKSLRRRNVRGAFQWVGRNPDPTNPPLAVIVDDIMTTGATALYAAKTLKAAGFTRIIVAVLARGKSRTTGPFHGGIV